MIPSTPSARRRRDFQLNPESLETRELLTGGAGSTFAIIPASITKAGQAAVVNFTIDSTHFTMPKGKMMLGIDVVPVTGSTVKPVISAVTAPKGMAASSVIHSAYAAKLPSSSVAAGSMTSAVITPVHVNSKSPNSPETYSVRVTGKGGTTGNFLLGFYLPGDANGSGNVNQTNLNLVKSAIGSKGGASNYNFDADSNRDGKITAADLNYAKQNLGVKTTISPSVSANLDPASVTTMSDRVTSLKTVHFSGTVTPGSAVKFSETANKVQPVATTADASGNYNLYVPLGNGANTFQVSTLDSFGQAITGTIAPVTYQASPVVTSTTVAALQAQANLGLTATTSTATTSATK